MKNLRFKTIFILILLFNGLSCTKKESITTNITNRDKIINSKYAVSENTIKAIALNFILFNNSSNNRITSTRTIKDIYTLKDNMNIPAYYIINFDENLGYILLSADYRQEPILGYNENFNFDINNIPIQLNDFVVEQINEIDYLRDNNIDSIFPIVRDSWAELIPINGCDNTAICGGSGPTDGGDSAGCDNYEYHYQKGPLLLTNWGQTWPFNLLCPPGLNCTNTLTGCVATAMAQIINFNKWPNTYDYTLMLNPTSSNECARLMHDAGVSVSMNYGCTASGAYTEDVAPALKNTFNYSSSTYCTNLSSGPVTNSMKQDLGWNKPMYLSGSGSSGGHAWVCDGYKEDYWGCSGFFAWHMNWGWFGQSNGWYNMSNFNPTQTSFSFNNNKKVVFIRK